MADGQVRELSRADFEDLYNRLGGQLHAYLRRQVGDPDTASDLLQDVFVRLLRSPVQARSGREIKGYLYRTAASVIADHFRREGRAKRWSVLTGRPKTARTAPATGVERVFRELPLRDRTLLWLAYVEEMTHEEIAEVIGVKRASVKVLLSRARGRLSAKLKEHCLGLEAIE